MYIFCANVQLQSLRASFTVKTCIITKILIHFLSVCLIYGLNNTNFSCLRYEFELSVEPCQATSCHAMSCQLTYSRSANKSWLWFDSCYFPLFLSSKVKQQDFLLIMAVKHNEMNYENENDGKNLIFLDIYPFTIGTSIFKNPGTDFQFLSSLVLNFDIFRFHRPDRPAWVKLIPFS